MKVMDPYPLLGTRVDALTLEDLNGTVADAITDGRHWVIANHNLNSLNLHHRDEMMQEFYRHADVVHVDGMPVIAIGRLLGLPLRREHRVTYVDWMPSLVELAAARGWRIFYLGSKPGIVDRGAQRLRDEHPGLALEARDGFFDATIGSPENEAVLAAIEAFEPHILMVGMGMPRQERWILQNRARLSANVILPAGACMDYVAGAVATPPRWMGRVGLEWLFRLLCEPRRLWRRYLVEPWLVARLLASELIRSG